MIHTKDFSFERRFLSSVRVEEHKPRADIDYCNRVVRPPSKQPVYAVVVCVEGKGFMVGKFHCRESAESLRLKICKAGNDEDVYLVDEPERCQC